MKQKKGSASQMEAVKESWKRHIMLEKGYSEQCAKWMAERIAALVEYMQYGHALVAYRKQTGEFQLARATLIYYEGEFHKRYDPAQIKSTLLYYHAEQRAWRTLQIENFLEWRPVV